MKTQRLSIGTFEGVRGFTLIELLVVIAIVSLLLSVLVPSLNRARDYARQTVCMSHLRPVGMAIAAYAMNYDNFFPGPNTSGRMLTITNDPAVAGLSSMAPVQNVDWISPLLGDSLGLSEDRKERIREIFDTQMRCPSNRKTFDFEYTGSGGGLFTPSEVQSMTAASYSASLAFHVYSISDGYRGSEAINESVADRVYLPRGYSPRLTKIGRPSDKIFAFDGTRYVETDGRISFNSFAKQIQGGNYMCYGPATPQAGDPFRWTSFGDPQFDAAGITKTFSFRHRGRINLAFFDGRAASLAPEEALRINYYWPSGSTVRRGRWTYDVRAVDNQVIR